MKATVNYYDISGAKCYFTFVNLSATCLLRCCYVSGMPVIYTEFRLNLHLHNMFRRLHYGSIYSVAE